MDYSTKYFQSARKEEIDGHDAPALLLYLSSFCASFNSGSSQYPFQATEKICRLQKKLFLTDSELSDLVHSYGPLSDLQCRKLLAFCKEGNVSGIQAICSGGAYES